MAPGSQPTAVTIDTIEKELPQLHIDIPLFDLKYDKMKEGIRFYIDLYPQYIIVEVEAYLDRLPTPKDQEEGRYSTQEDFYMRETDFILKRSIDTVESYFGVDDEIWVCMLCFNGREKSFKFQTESEMRSLENILQQYTIS